MWTFLNSQYTSHEGIEVRNLLAFTLAAASACSSLATPFEKAGDHLQLVSPAIAMGILAVEDSSAAKDCGWALAGTLTTVRVLKTTIREPRPNGGPYGFPSGHSAAAALGAGCLYAHEGLSWRTTALLGATAITATSRVHAEKHSVKQVIAGSLIGFYAPVLLKEFRLQSDPRARARLTFGPTERRKYELTLRIDF